MKHAQYYEIVEHMVDKVMLEGKTAYYILLSSGETAVVNWQDIAESQLSDADITILLTLSKQFVESHYTIAKLFGESEQKQLTTYLAAQGRTLSKQEMQQKIDSDYSLYELLDKYVQRMDDSTFAGGKWHIGKKCMRMYETIRLAQLYMEEVRSEESYTNLLRVIGVEVA